MSIPPRTGHATSSGKDRQLSAGLCRNFRRGLDELLQAPSVGDVHHGQLDATDQPARWLVVIEMANECFAAEIEQVRDVDVTGVDLFVCTQRWLHRPLE